MITIPNEKKIAVCLLSCLVTIGVFFQASKVWAEAEKLNARNASDSLMLLMELATEAGGSHGGCFTKAQKSHAYMIRKYVNHMEDRYVSLFLQLPQFPGKSVIKKLKTVAEELEKEVDSNDVADEKIEWASKEIAQCLAKGNFLSGKSTVIFEPEIMSEEMRNIIVYELEEAHKKAEIYAANPTLPNAEAACMSNRRAIVCLYLARFGYQDFIDRNTLKIFRTDINRTLYYNRVLQQSDPIKQGKNLEGQAYEDSDYKALETHSDSELRRLRLLQTIIDNDIPQAQALLKITIGKKLPDTEIS